MLITKSGWYRTNSGRIIYCMILPRYIANHLTYDIIAFDQVHNPYAVVDREAGRTEISSDWIIEYLPECHSFDYKLERWAMPTVKNCSSTLVYNCRVKNKKNDSWTTKELLLVYVSENGFYLTDPKSSKDGPKCFSFCEILIKD